MAEETGDDDFSDVGLGGVGTTAGYAHYSDQKKAITRWDSIQSFKGRKRERESNKRDRDTDTETELVAMFLSLLDFFLWEKWTMLGLYWKIVYLLWCLFVNYYYVM